MTAALKAGGPLLRPLNALLLSYPIALFSAALATDITYLRTAEIQWTNFSSWLIAGALLFGGLVLAGALIALLLGWRGPDRKRSLIQAGVLGLMWILGLVNAFKHSQDAWSSVGTFGLALSIACTLLALGAGFIAYSDHTRREIAG